MCGGSRCVSARNAESQRLLFAPSVTNGTEGGKNLAWWNLHFIARRLRTSLDSLLWVKSSSNALCLLNGKEWKSERSNICAINLPVARWFTAEMCVVVCRVPSGIWRGNFVGVWAVMSFIMKCRSHLDRARELRNEAVRAHDAFRNILEYWRGCSRCCLK